VSWADIRKTFSQTAEEVKRYYPQTGIEKSAGCLEKQGKPGYVTTVFLMIGSPADYCYQKRSANPAADAPHRYS